MRRIAIPSSFLTLDLPPHIRSDKFNIPGAVKNDQRPLALSPTKSREGEIDGVFEASKFSAARSRTCAIQTIFAAWPTSPRSPP